MRKKSIQKSFITILISSTLSKMFALVSKIALTSILGIKIMSIFGLINPLLILIITLSSFSLPSTLTYLISSKRSNSKIYIKTSIILIFLISIFLSSILYFFSSYIGYTFFHNEQVIPSIKTLALLVPLISFTSLLKGYYQGIKEVTFSSSSQLFEEGFRLIFNLFLIELLLKDNESYNATLLVISLCVGEIGQVIYFIFFSKTNYQKNYFKLLKKDNKFEFKKTSKEIIDIALPLTLSRLIGSITYFLEPVILTTIMTKLNYSIDIVTYEYGVLTTYVMSLLLLPGFFSLALSTYLLPHLSETIANNNYQKSMKIFKSILSLCLLIGLSFSCIFFFFGNNILELLYNIKLEKDLFKYLAFPFLIYYFETPINTALQAFSMSKISFITTTISCIIRIILLFIFIPILKTNAIILSTLISCFITVIVNLFFIRKGFLSCKEKISI